MINDIDRKRINMVITKEAYVKLKLKICEDFFITGNRTYMSKCGFVVVTCS